MFRSFVRATGWFPAARFNQILTITLLSGAVLDAIRNIFGLLLPALIPSWRFFKAVQPSPRIEWRFPDQNLNKDAQWQPFRPRPSHLSWATILRRLFWNPDWNDALYMDTCAERLTAHPTDQLQQEILARLFSDLPPKSHATALQFRLKFIDRADGLLQDHVTFISDIHPIPGNTT